MNEADAKAITEAIVTLIRVTAHNLDGDGRAIGLAKESLQSKLRNADVVTYDEAHELAVESGREEYWDY